MNIDNVVELCLEGLSTDGADHKQWCLEQVLEQCGIKEEYIVAKIGDYYRGIAP